MGTVRRSKMGFTLVETVLAIVVLSAVVVTGLFVYNTHNASIKKSAIKVGTANDAATNLPQSTPPQETSESPSTPEPSYMIIKEWDLRIQLTGLINDAYYQPAGYDTSGDTIDQIALSLTALKGTQCKAGGWPPSIYYRYTATDTDPVTGKLYTELSGTAHKIGDYYYAYGDGYGINRNGGCQSTIADQSKANEAAIAFKDALNTLEPITQ